MRIDTEEKLDFSDVLLKPKRSRLKSRKDVKLTRTFNFVHSKREWTGIPIMVANMDTVGTFEMFEKTCTQKAVTALHKHYSAEELIEFFNGVQDDQLDYVFYSIGMRNEDVEKLAVVQKGTNNRIYNINIDTPNGYSEYFVEFVRKMRKTYPNATISAGNVCTGEMTQELILAGADIVKVGIGGGSACTTRMKTAVGMPQLSAIMECADAAHGVNGHIIGDGGITSPGDFCVGFAGGADFLMAGGYFAGHLGKKIRIDGKDFLEFYGMSSRKANEKHAGGLRDYRASEGRELLIPYKGEIEDTFQDIYGGLRSCAAYIGAEELKHFNKCATFCKVRRRLNDSMAQHSVKL